ncbi:D-arabinono-1,4-lactone oxidase [Nocardioides piscis]|uniref:FAD-binding protein n=1 Tax=Nocardioides piscis TaxID=2714938 RepID=A0A6G7YHS7_9ACTN|nr:D-arabinono-1,4-lactone oxidase [Nocardioides piscis]QIK76330.1 FAD-binding protein [Nocardioides piscis]
MAGWTNWASTETAHPQEIVTPRATQQIVDQVEHARAHGRKVKMVGSGHSFTGISAPVDVMVMPHAHTGILSVDRDAMTVTALAGTQLHVLNSELERMGLSLYNMGDIAEQTIAGAVSTGTHGTGGTASSISAQVAGFTIVTGHGEVVSASPTASPEIFELGRVGLGALGILTEITFRVVPLFGLAAHERSATWGTLLATYDELTSTHDHVDVYWFPHTDQVMVKTNDRLPGIDGLRPLGRWKHWVQDELFANTVFGVLTDVGVRAPAAVPRINRLATSSLSERRYSDVAHKVFTSPRRVRFKEMEYAVPREGGLEVLEAVRRRIDRSSWQIGFPIEIRATPADDVTLSTSVGRESMYLAFHVPARADHAPYFAGVEEILRAAGGRPHWGKMHTMVADDLASVYPGFEDFLRLRDRLDPERLFTNPYLDRVLGI